jgi:threonine dehydrogenase-like Zn-dependent dehydrogenase
MASRSAAAVAVGDRRFELMEFPLPPVHDADGLLRVEASGICGSDLKKYSVKRMSPTVLGHETVGRIDTVGALASRRWGVTEGDRVLLEEYLPCGHCAYCRSGEFRSCRETDNKLPGSIRYGSTPVDVAPALWGGYSQYQYLHLNSVLHAVPDGVPPEQAAFAIPLSNGIQWSQLDGGVRAGDTLLIQGPGQQGIGCLMGGKLAGADQVIVSGLSRDAQRLGLAKSLGADVTVDAETQDLEAVVREITGGRLADVVIDVSGGGATTLMTALRSVRKGGTVIMASGSGGRPGDLDLNLIRKKQVTIKGVRGHSFAAVETALRFIAAGRVQLDLVCGAPWALPSIAEAFEAASGAASGESLHVSVSAWAPDLAAAP